LVDLAPNAVSFHLRILRSAGLLAAQRNGRSLEYRVEPRNLSAWLGEVRRLFPDEHIASLAAESKRQNRRRGSEETETTGDRSEEAPNRAADTGPLPTELL
jgi:DNA-binding transcriptional ArsR family regulator